MIVFGGCDVNGSFCRDVSVYNYESGEWSNPESTEVRCVITTKQRAI